MWKKQEKHHRSTSADTYVHSSGKNFGHKRKRVSSRFSSIFGSKDKNNELELVKNAMRELSLTSDFMMKISDSQIRGTNLLTTWARASGNSALEDVMENSYKLFSIFAQVQRKFADEYFHFVEQLKKITESDMSVQLAKQQVVSHENEVCKIRSEMRRSFRLCRRSKGGDEYLLKEKLNSSISARDIASNVLSCTRAEMEVIKMFKFRYMMQGISDSYIKLARDMMKIFTCNREITELVPAITTEDVRHMTYDGRRITKERVQHLKRSLENDVQDESFSVCICDREEIGKALTPPPPYCSPSVPQQIHRNNKLVQRSCASDSKLLALRPPYYESVSDANSNKVKTQKSPNGRDTDYVKRTRRSFPVTQSSRLYPDLSEGLISEIEELELN